MIVAVEAGVVPVGIGAAVVIVVIAEVVTTFAGATLRVVGCPVVFI